MHNKYNDYKNNSKVCEEDETSRLMKKDCVVGDKCFRPKSVLLKKVFKIGPVYCIN